MTASHGVAIGLAAQREEGTQTAVNIVAIASFVTALAALYISIDNWRKSTTHVLRLVRTDSAYHQTADWSGYAFHVYIKNLGLPLHRMTATLAFRDWGRRDLCSSQLRVFDMESEDTHWQCDLSERGLVVKMGFDTRCPCHVLSRLSDPAAQGARLEIYSAGYLVRTARIGGPVDQAASGIHRLLFKLYERLKIGFFAENPRTWQAGIPMPHYGKALSDLRQFLSGFRSKTV